ncbi:MAG: type II toxin-antitoxin system RelE/ParE family toxin [Candidatus Omnitrophica bacterium]|nr:type II toxin-antitoxin system RelE/ParE family toxin [Candidatus Omnitrophota bacterium]MBU1869472.1 type II toxin-antitoxin system RelE/ParE family toxin [Candidatus Omnitrophota bacterium]
MDRSYDVPRYICSYYKKDNDEIPVKKFIDSLSFQAQRKFFFVVKLLEEFGPKLPQPHAKYIGEGIFELRFSAQEGAIRILYFFYGQGEAIFTNAFIKKSQKLPDCEKAVGIERRRLFINETRKS